MKVYVENKDKMTSYLWGYDEKSKRYFVKLNFDLPSDAKVKVLSLSDYTKQVRKELVKEIKQEILKTTSYETEEELHSYLYDLNAGSVLDILDQIQGE